MSLSNPNETLDGSGLTTKEMTVNGMTFAAGSTPEERFAAIAQANGVTVTKPQPQPQFHTDSTAMRLDQGEAPSAKESELMQAYSTRLSNAAKLGTVDSPRRVEAEREAKADYEKALVNLFEGKPAEMSPGVRLERPGSAVRFEETPSIPADQVDQKLLDRLNEVWRNMSPEEREAKRPTYERDLASIYAGRRNGEGMKEFEARKNGTPVPKKYPIVPTPENPGEWTPSQWEAHHASHTDTEGQIPLERVNPAALSGYTLPRFIEGQTVTRDIFSMLAHARAAGITQDQLNAAFKSQMIADGWIKS